MTRRAWLAAGAVLLLAGCGGAHHGAVTTVPSTTTVTRTHTVPTAPKPKPRRKPRPTPKRGPCARSTVAVVTVVDGDLSRRVPGARVAVGAKSVRSDRRGEARIPLRRAGAYLTTASKPGYDTRTVRLPYCTHPASAIRIYRTDLQWPLYGATRARTHHQDALRVRPPFRVVWTRGLGSLIEFPAVVSDGVAYIGNAHETIRAISMSDGTVAWRHDVPGGKLAASPAVWGDDLVVHGMDGVVRVLRRSNGGQVAARRVGSPIESSPIVVGGVDVFGTWDGRIEALDLRTGHVRWRRQDGCKITSSAAVVGSTAYIGDYCGRILALDRRTGATRWSRSVNGRVYGTPAVAGGRVFVPSSDGDSLTAFSMSGRYLWRRSFGSYVYCSPAVSGGRVFVGDYGGGFYALSAASGATIWEVGAGGSVSGAAVVVDGVAYAGSFGHEIVGVDARSGRVLVRFPHGEYVPVSGGGRRLLLHGYSRLYAVEAKR